MACNRPVAGERCCFAGALLVLVERDLPAGGGGWGSLLCLGSGKGVDGDKVEEAGDSC